MFEVSIDEAGQISIQLDGKAFTKIVRLNIHSNKGADMVADMNLYWDDGLNLTGVLIPEYGLPVGKVPFNLHMFSGTPNGGATYVTLDGEQYRAWDVEVVLAVEEKPHVAFTVQMGDRAIRIAGNVYGAKELDEPVEVYQGSKVPVTVE